jgi:hypothetical protein
MGSFIFFHFYEDIFVLSGVQFLDFKEIQDIVWGKSVQNFCGPLATVKGTRPTHGRCQSKKDLGCLILLGPWINVRAFWGWIRDEEPLRMTENRIYYMDSYNYTTVVIRPEAAEHCCTSSQGESWTWSDDEGESVRANWDWHLSSWLSQQGCGCSAGETGAGCLGAAHVLASTLQNWQTGRIWKSYQSRALVF